MRGLLELVCWKGLEGGWGGVCYENNQRTVPPAHRDRLKMCCTSTLLSGVYDNGLRSGMCGDGMEYGVETNDESSQAVRHGKSVARTSIGEYSGELGVALVLRVSVPLCGDSGSGGKPSYATAAGSHCRDSGGVSGLFGCGGEGGDPASLPPH